MTSKINADTTNGLVMTPDTSGEIELQAGGTKIATVKSTGIDIASGKDVLNLPKSSMPTGSVLQVVQTSLTSIAVSSTSLVEIGKATITPSSTSSKILVMAHTYVHRNTGGATGDYWSCKLLRGGVSGTTLETLADAVLHQTYGNGARQTLAAQYLDSPSTTSATDYTLGAARQAGSTSAQFNHANIGQITLMEIAG